MARNHKKMALYEVINKTLSKPGYGRALGQLHPEKSGKNEPIEAKSVLATPEKTIQWPKKPRMLQFNKGRLELSVPYPLAIAVLLSVTLVVVVVFRFGQITSLNSPKIANLVVKVPEKEQKVMIEPTPFGAAKRIGIETVPLNVETVSLSKEKAEPAKSKGNNRIVMQTWPARPQLEPIGTYFASLGIETEIRKVGSMYYLVTKEKYENPEKAGTNGYLAKQKIVELGAKYNAPERSGSFGPKPFSDAYGMKFDD